ncbi:MAG: PQQ-binding-like beta-propeller repeat protein [Planctomycetales bacterium]
MMPRLITPLACLLVAFATVPECGADDAAEPRDALRQQVVAEGSATDWPQWRGPDRDGRSLATGLLQDWTKTKPKLLWTAKGMGKGHGSVAVANGRIFTTGGVRGAQAIVAVEERSGEILWTTTVKPQGGHRDSHSTPAVDGGRVYVLASGGVIACLDAADGRIVWQKDCGREWKAKAPGYGYSGSPLVDGEKLICAPGGDALLVALDKTNGDEIWRAAVPDAGGVEYSSPVVSHGGGVKQYVQLVGRGVIGVRADDGRFLWKYGKVANGTANIPTCITTGDHVFCSSGYGTGAALLKLAPAADGGVKAEEVYFVRGGTLQNHHGGMVLVGEHVYLGNGHNQGFPTCVELKTGKIVWGGKIRGPGSGSAAVAYADGHLVFRYQSGEVALVAASPRDYELRGSFRPEHVADPSWSHPVVANGRLFLRDQDVLMSYDVTAND